MEHNIITPSWELINKTNTIKKFNFLPSLLSTLYLSIIVFYQIAFTYIYIFELKDQFFSLVIDFVHKAYFIEVLITLAVWFVLYIFIKPLAEGWIVCLIDAFYNRETWKYRLSYWISQWLLHFLPVFEFHNFMWLFRLLSIITFYFLTLRIFGQNYAFIISIIFSIYLLLSFVINILFAYSKFFIIFEKKWMFEAISLSTRMTLHNMSTTSKLYFTLFLVYLRIILTVIMFLVFPIIVSTIFAYISSKFFFIFFISLILIIFIIFLLLITHLNSVVEIFVDSLWYNAYIDNKKTFEIWEN